MNTHTLKLTDSQIGTLCNALRELPYLDPACFDGPKHREICLSLAPTLHKRLASNYYGGLLTHSLRFAIHDLSLMHLAILNAKGPEADQRVILGQIGPIVIHT